MIKRLRIYVFDYWHYLLFGMFALIVVLSVMYFNQNIYEQRHQRLMDVNVDKKPQSPSPDIYSGPDRMVEGSLLPLMHHYLPLPSDWNIEEKWGEPVMIREHRIPELPLRDAPPRRGPDGSS